MVDRASLPPDAESQAGWDTFIADVQRPAAQARVKALVEQGLGQPGDLENHLNQATAKYASSRGVAWVGGVGRNARSGRFAAWAEAHRHRAKPRYRRHLRPIDRPAEFWCGASGAYAPCTRTHHTMKRLLGLTLAATAGLSLATTATAAPARVRGTVVAISSTALTVHTAKGDVSALLKGDTAFVSVVPSDLNHVGTGSYVGAASKNVGDKLIALSVIVFPPEMKGAAEGHAAYDVLPDTTLSGGARTASSMTNANVKALSARQSAPRVNSTMTNGSVATATAKGDTRLLTVTYKGGEQNILVPPTAPIVALCRAQCPSSIRARPCS